MFSARNIPRRVRVADVLSGRYGAGEKPLDWNVREGGVDRIRTSDGETLTLYSTGGQSTPAPGWEILLTKERPQLASSEPAFLWTLYGIHPTEKSTNAAAKSEAL